MNNEYCLHDINDYIYYKDLTRSEAISIGLDKNNLDLIISPVLLYKYYSPNLNTTGREYYILDTANILINRLEKLIIYSKNNNKYIEYIKDLKFNIIHHNYPKNILSIISNLFELIINNLSNLDNVENEIKDVCYKYSNPKFK